MQRAALASLLLGLSLVTVACGDDLRGNITIVPAPQFQAALADFVALTPYRGLSLGGAPAEGYQIVVTDDASLPAEGYQLAVDGDTITVRAHDVLGAQYGTAEALEGLGFRFRHPFDPYLPFVPTLGPIDTAVHRPDVRVRGMQLHTLHPIEGYYAVWEPSVENLHDAKRIVDWIVKNRGNYLQWVPLDNILVAEHHAAWKAHTQAIIAYAHERGVRVGINIQLFGASNLQNAFDLVDKPTEPIAPQIAARLPLITADLPFDVYTLSFGEFFNADPALFISTLNEVRAQLRTHDPAAEMHALIHVGGEQRITYMGEDLIYYFLVKFADPSIIPDIHTVMFYNLFEDAGGAYQQDTFEEHRAYLQQRMCAGQRAAYQPETAYWVAFDNSVPQFYPLYVRSRLLDLAKLQEPEGPCGTLDQHYLFSSGWEWGYWLNDVASLRASYELVSADDAIASALAPDLAAAAPLISELMELQHAHVMLERLTGYLVGRDSVIDLGRQLDIISQPDRVTFDQLVAGDGRAEVETMVGNLTIYAEAVTALASRLAALDLPDSRWTRELRDGATIDGLRARFVLATYAAVLAEFDGDRTHAEVQRDLARDLLARARTVVAGRHGDLHDARGRRHTERTSNQTFYQFGYLAFANNLCYWERELAQVDGVFDATSPVPPACFF